jgi:hypothetical protein
MCPEFNDLTHDLGVVSFDRVFRFPPAIDGLAAKGFLSLAASLALSISACTGGGSSPAELDASPDSAVSADLAAPSDESAVDNLAAPDGDSVDLVADAPPLQEVEVEADLVDGGAPDVDVTVEADPGSDETTPDAVEAFDCSSACAAVECGAVGTCECGGCADGLTCSEEGKCEAAPDPCETSCLEAEYECGAMTSQCDCGTCGDGFICAYHKCEEDPCPALCEGRECGIVGAWYLGVSCDCGQCDPDYFCDLYTWTCKCLPQCKDPVSLLPYECGDDLCGGICGTCAEGLVCSPQHKCVAAEGNQ